MSAPRISAGIINYNGRDVIGGVIDSVMASDYQVDDILVVDDFSTDGSPAFIERTYPNVRVFRQPRNMGPNAARNRVLKEAKEKIVFISDNDITLAPDCLKLLVETLLRDSKTAVSTPMVLDSADTDRIYSNGAGLHFVCFGVIPHRYTPVSDIVDWNPHRSVCGSGGIMLVRKSATEELGGFDEDFFFGYDDGEFTFRVTGAGWNVLQVPKARIYHIEKPRRGQARLRYQVKGKWSLILKTYSLRSLIILSPALVAFEMATFLFLLTKGAAGEWARGMAMVLANMDAILKKRRAFQAKKKRPDNELLTSGAIYMFPGRVGSRMFVTVKKVIEQSLSLYWRIVKPVLTR